MRHLVLPVAAFCALLGLAAAQTGALVSVSANGFVGVLLDDIPAAQQSKAISILQAKPTQFWIDRATRQIDYTQMRLNFRPYYYTTVKGELPLPPKSQWQFTFSALSTQSFNAHKLFGANYVFTTTILTDNVSLAQSEAALGVVGGTWEEDVMLPADPMLLLQRTGYACMDESEFPPHSLDPESPQYYYDDTCKVEPPQAAGTVGCQQCHCTLPLPTVSCKAALKQNIGAITLPIIFTRLAWSDSLANAVRTDPVPTAHVNLVGSVADLVANQRAQYIYFAAGSCELGETCIQANGWRRVFKFGTLSVNYGTQPMILGQVDYFYQTPQNATDLVTVHHIFEFSQCHQHYHFLHYGQFGFGPLLNTNMKRGFCLQSTARGVNAEWSPVNQPFYTCSYQGMAPGWSDNYNAGLPCQWLDVTAYPTASSPYTGWLYQRDNPDGFLCEGVPVVDANGNQVWVDTTFKTALGETVQKPLCNFDPGYDRDNLDNVTATIPISGGSYVTQDCKAVAGSMGAMRDCGFRFESSKQYLSCTPGANTTLTCSVRTTSPSAANYQVIRVCESSINLKTGTACDYMTSLANAVVPNTGAVSVSFTCPSARDSVEVGGRYSLYVAPFFEEDVHDAKAVVCN